MLLVRLLNRWKLQKRVNDFCESSTAFESNACCFAKKLQFPGAALFSSSSWDT